MTGFEGIPGEESCIMRRVRASKPSGGSIISSVSSLTAMIMMRICLFEIIIDSHSNTQITIL